MKRILVSLLVSCLFDICLADAQSLMVNKVTMQPNDKTAFLSPCLDSNGDTCALIKIQVSDVEGIEFPNKNQYVKSSYADGVYQIYMPTISRRLDYRHVDYLPGQIDFGEYGYRRLRAGKTYFVQMEASSNANKESLLILKVHPVSARVSFNGSDIGISSTGIYEFPLREGSYSYKVIMDNYSPLSGTVPINKDENKTLALTLEPIMHTVKVNCNVDDAHVFVDNIDYGEVGVLSLPQGNHHIRIQGDGYLDVDENVNIQNGMNSLSYSLKKNKNIKEIHATPVRIYSSSSRIYKNQKVIGEWRKSGDIVKIMPGEWEISDKDKNVKRIIVGSEPMDVYLGNTNTSASEEVTNSKQDVDNSIRPNYRRYNYLQQNSTYNSRQNSTVNGNINNYNTYQNRSNTYQNRSNTYQNRSNTYQNRSNTYQNRNNNTQRRSTFMNRSSYTNRSTYTNRSKNY